MADLAGRRVLLGTPSHDFRTDVRFNHSLNNTLRLCLKQGVDLREIYLSGDSIIQNARNDLVKLALKSGFDDLVFVDSDQDWEASDFLKLLSYDVDCVGAAIRKKTDEELFNVKSTGGVFGFIAHPKYELLTSPDMTLGTGFIRFSRHALQILWDNSEKYRVMGGEEAAWVFDIRPKNGVLVGEDTAVCERLREFGIPTWVDPSIVCGHIGMKRYAGEFGEWLAKMQA